MAGSIVCLWRTNPDIFAARSGIRPGTKDWDRALLVVLLLSFPFAFLSVWRYNRRMNSPMRITDVACDAKQK
jgi:hypothetical protein